MSEIDGSMDRELDDLLSRVAVRQSECKFCGAKISSAGPASAGDRRREGRTERGGQGTGTQATAGILEVMSNDVVQGREPDLSAKRPSGTEGSAACD